MTTLTERHLQGLVAPRLDVDPDRVPLDEPFMAAIGLDSFDAMEVVLDIEAAYERVDLSDPEARDLATLREVAAYIDRRMARVSPEGSALPRRS